MKNIPAFPRPHSHDVDPRGICVGDRREDFQDQTGMTIRDYFAAKAMQANITTYTEADYAGYVESIARKSYEMADAMLKAREQE